MAIPATTIWEVRTGASSSNGGGFDPVSGTPGTDYSQQTSAQVAYTDLVINAVTNTQCTSVTTPFTSAHVGNIINITGGVGFTIQRVQILSVATGIATCDKSLGTLSSVSGIGNLGGALAGPENADLAYSPGNVIYIASGVYSSSLTRTLTCDGSLTGGEISLIGYLAGGSRLDSDVVESSMPGFTTGTNSIAKFTLNGVNRVRLRNIKITDTAGTRGDGFTVSASSTGVVFENCIVDGCLRGFYDGGNSLAGSTYSRCLARNCTSAGFFGAGSGSVVTLSWCVATANAGYGFETNGIGHVYLNCLSYANTGANGHGFADVNTTSDVAAEMIFRNCVAYGNAQSGFRFAYTTGGMRGMEFDNCISEANAAFGSSCATSGLMDGTYPRVRNFAYYNNTSGLTQNFRSGEGQITGSSSFFTNAAGGDFSLSTYGKSVLQGMGYPTELGPRGSTTATFPNVGASDPQAASSGGFILGS